jgi:putative endonuclease
MTYLSLRRHHRHRRHPRESGDPERKGNNELLCYVLSSKMNGTLYVGVTNNMTRRMCEHKAKLIKGFTEKYNVDKLMYIEGYDRIDEAIYREKCIKKWNSASKPLTQAGKTYLNICCNWIPAYAGMTGGSDALVNFREVALNFLC